MENPEIYLNFAIDPEIFFCWVPEALNFLWEILVVNLHRKLDDVPISWTRQWYMYEITSEVSITLQVTWIFYIEFHLINYFINKHFVGLRKIWGFLDLGVAKVEILLDFGDRDWGWVGRGVEWGREIDDGGGSRSRGVTT